jgi:Flp pilus assembly protein protease CpaA
LQLQLRERRRRQSIAWAIILIIVVVAAGIGAFHWTHECHAWSAPTQQASDVKAAAAATPPNKLSCVLSGIAIVIAIAAGTFALVMLGWWVLTDLDGLKGIFEIGWTGLDGGDVENVGSLECVIRAGACILAILAGLFLAGFAAVAVLDGRVLQFSAAEEKKPGQAFRCRRCAGEPRRGRRHHFGASPNQ